MAVLAGYCIEKSHACVGKWQERSDSHVDPTCDVHVHNASAGTDAVGGVTDICPGQVVGHRALEEQGVVFDFHISGERAVQAVKTENKNGWITPGQRHKKELRAHQTKTNLKNKTAVSSAIQRWIHVKVR